MDTRIALAGRDTDVYGALMRGYQGGMLRRQDRQQEEDRAVLHGALAQRYANDPTAGVLARTQEGQEMLEIERKQQEYAQKQRTAAMPVIAGMSERLLQIETPEERTAAIQGYMPQLAQTLGPEGAQFFAQAFADTSTEALTRNVQLGKIQNPTKVFGNTIWGKDDAGGDVLLAMDDRAQAHVVDKPKGVTSLSPPIDYLNVNSGYVPVPRYAQIPQGGGEQIPKGIDPAEQPPFLAAQTTAQKNAENSARISAAAFDQLAGLAKSIANYDDALATLAKGAETGPIAQYFPSFQAASVELGNIQSRMGLDIVGATTFGSLSESELSFALSTALPTGLDKPELEVWIKKKRDAQVKLRKELTKVAQFMGGGGAIPEYLEILESTGKYNTGSKKPDALEERARKLGIYDE